MAAKEKVHVSFILHLTYACLFLDVLYKLQGRVYHTDAILSANHVLSHMWYYNGNKTCHGIWQQIQSVPEMFLQIYMPFDHSVT